VASPKDDESRSSSDDKPKRKLLEPGIIGAQSVGLTAADSSRITSKALVPGADSMDQTQRIEVPRLLLQLVKDHRAISRATNYYVDSFRHAALCNRSVIPIVAIHLLHSPFSLSIL
jgi:hypothetical protein